MAQYSLITSKCPDAKNDTVAGVLNPSSPLQVYNFLAQLSDLEANPTACGTVDATLEWKRNVSQDLIECCGENRMDYKFFENEWSSTPKQIDSRNYFQRYASNESENILSASAQHVAASATNKFTLHASSHSGSGTSSSLAVDMMIYNYRTQKTLRITAIDTSIKKNHVVSVISTDGTNVDIDKNDKFMRIPATAVGGSSVPTGETTMNTHWTSKQVNRLRLRKHWEMEMQVDRPYSDQMMFAPWRDKNNNVTWAALPTMKMRCMQELTQAANVFLFIGNTISNASIDVDDWTAGEGMIEAIKGAGNQYDYDPTTGFSMEHNFEPIIMAEDAMKRTTDWVLYGALPFKAGLIRRANKDAKETGGNVILPLNYPSQTRGGTDNGVINKAGFEEYNYLGRSIKFKEWGVLSTSNGLGNGIFPHLGILLANNNLYNNKGETVPPIEFFHSQNQVGQWASLMENDRNGWILNGLEKIEGDMIKSMLYMVHCPNRHYLIYPMSC